MEKRKEIVTKEIFVAEKRKLFTKSMLQLSLFLLPLFSVGFLVCALYSPYPWIVFGILETVFLSILIVFGYIPQIKNWSRIKTNNFFVTQDILLSSVEGQHTKRSIPSLTSKYIPYTLYFSKHGKYYVPPLNYTWSKEFKATDEDVYNRACNGDTFILFITGKTILEAYNTKAFEYKETFVKEDLS